MPLLTLTNLIPNGYPFYYDYHAIRNGLVLFQDKHVELTSFEGRSATCIVHDPKNGDYTVTLIASGPQLIEPYCTCPKGAGGSVCKHMVAGVYAVREYVKKDVQYRWQYKIELALEHTPPRKKPKENYNKYALVFGLLHQSMAYAPDVYLLVPYVISQKKWPGIRDLQEMDDQSKQTERLDKDRTWTPYAQSMTNSRVDLNNIVNLPYEKAFTVDLLVKANRYYYGLPDLPEYLPVLAQLDIPLFMLRDNNRFQKRLRILKEPIQIEAALASDGSSYSLEAGVTLSGENFSTLKKNLFFLSKDPVWVMAGTSLARLENPDALALVNSFPITVPAEDVAEFRDTYLGPLLEHLPVHGDVISWTDVEVEPKPRLYLRDDGGTLRADLRFAYGDQEVALNTIEQISVRPVAGSWGMLRIHRRLDSEDEFFRLLTDSRYGLKRISGAQPGIFELRARTHPLDFLLSSIPALVKAGFEVYGEESLKTARINRNAPTISLNVSSGIDWFEINAVVQYGDQQVPLQAIRRAVNKKERFVKLADGSIGQIPEEWINRFKRLFDLGEESETGLRVRDVHLPLVDTLLEVAVESQVSEEFTARREILRGFEKIAAQPVPRGFTGELRAYQKAGLDWLHFLHEYGFGGCLADDMGLGKTIQVLAFLQSLKEQGKLDGPTLLVVPKSLMGNWLREAERFTPELRFLEYIGIQRQKDAQVFSGYDVILTTYGTMLRDVRLLHDTPFLYAILDESQAIKNPAAQVSKAVRLINARHRLVMTGTPVENSTFDLWSQFAFLNPGLLGGVDYFKREFATPIQARADNDTARLLRGLIYPFILRRTKAQVAPELPPRTERIIYTDLEPAQRKLYNHTRDYYRGMLMGLIDSEGINDVRMKILEGLLRLRQICIHPALIEAGYHGEAAKFEMLLETLDTLHAEGHKALVFSQFVESLRLLRLELDARKIAYVYLDGHTTDRQEKVDRFQDDPAIPFFLISLKAGGVGLNLTAADYVIHVDPWWNPAVETQAADRAHRIGQDKPVFVYKIIARDSVEEKILKLQERKKDLVDQLITTETSFFKSLTREDVKVLFS